MTADRTTTERRVQSMREEMRICRRCAESMWEEMRIYSRGAASMREEIHVDRKLEHTKNTARAVADAPLREADPAHAVITAPPVNSEEAAAVSYTHLTLPTICSV